MFRAQGPTFAVALLVSVVILGTLGYHWTEGWGLWRAFYTTILGITTVDLPPMSRSGRAFAQATFRHLLFGVVLGLLVSA